MCNLLLKPCIFELCYPCNLTFACLGRNFRFHIEMNQFLLVEQVTCINIAEKGEFVTRIASEFWCRVSLLSDIAGAML